MPASLVEAISVFVSVSVCDSFGACLWPLVVLHLCEAMRTIFNMSSINSLVCLAWRALFLVFFPLLFPLCFTMFGCLAR